MLYSTVLFFVFANKLPISLRGEIPSSNGQCSARGLARVAAVMANGGSMDGVTLVGPDTWREMHEGKVKKVDVAQNIPGVSPNVFTRGGLAYFE